MRAQSRAGARSGGDEPAQAEADDCRGEADLLDDGDGVVGEQRNVDGPSSRGPERPKPCWS